MKFKKSTAAGVAVATVGVISLSLAGANAVPFGFNADRSAEVSAAINPAKPRNVILFIGDGMDDSMITAARNYELGANGRFALDELPFTGAMTTYGLKVGVGPDYPIAYVSDSAPTASGWSTGKKTVDGRISQGPSAASTVPGEDYETVLEQYKKQGKLTGNITTSEITDATPAAAASHINARACQGPADMATCPTAVKSAGGKGSIAEQLVDNKVDVLMGGGLNRYTQNIEAGGTALNYATSTRGYRSVTTKAEMAAITSLTGGPVLGLFAGGNMTPRYAPLVAATAPAIAGGPTTKCTDADRGNQPSLAEMTTKSIALLDNPKGFFLQAESAMIDKQEHASDICGAIGDLRELDAAVKVALDYQKTHPDTLIIVTGDHAHSTQIVGGATDDGKQLAQVQTADGDPMTVAYSTGAVGSDHTGAQIRVAASGPQAANVTGTIDQTDLFQTLLGRTPSSLPVPPIATTTVTATPAPQPTATATATATATVTTPASPTTTAPQPSVSPKVGIAVPRKVSSKAVSGRLPGSVVATSATSVTVKVKQGDETIARITKSAKGGSFTVKLGRTTGKITVIAVAKGSAGSARSTKTVNVVR